jgi:replicative DNA helicase
MTRPQAIPESTLRAERAVIGACLIAPVKLRDLQVEVDDFAHLPHRAVFAAMRNLEAHARPIDTQTVEAQLSREGRLEAVGGIDTLVDLMLAPPLVEHVDEYAWEVRDAALKRRIALAAGEITVLAKNAGVSGDDLLADATARLGAIDGNKPEQTYSIGDLAMRRLADIERFAQELAAGRRALSGVPTGVAALDAKIGGWQFGIVNLLAARPGMGKSALALASADASSAAGIGAHVFSLEDSWHAYTDRQLARESGVSATSIRRATLEREDIAKIYSAGARLKSRGNWIVDERAGLSAREIVRSVRRHAERNKTRLVVVDYIQLVREHDPKAREDQQLGDTIAVFAEAAKADDMAYLVLSQFNRQVENRTDKRPQLSDLRGSGELEEKCKLAVGLYRGAYYGGEPRIDIDFDCDCKAPSLYCKEKHRPTDEEWQAEVQCLVLKGGNGPTGRVFATWHGPTVRIS